MSERLRIQDASGIICTDNINQALLAFGGTVPTSGTAGYAYGCMFIKTNGAVGTTWYVNVGTVTSCNFQPIDKELVINIAGGATIGGNLAVTGTSILSGNNTLTGTLLQSGAATLSSTLAVAGNATVTGTMVQTGAETVTGALTAQGGVTISSGETVTGRTLNQLEAIGPAPTDTYAASMTIDVTKSLHIISAANGTSAACTLTPSAAGTAGDRLTIITETDGSGTVTVTFASTFHSSGTQATTLSRFSSIVFISDGTRWVEECRTTALA